MAYDHDLAQRLREYLASETGVVEKPMFGGLAFLINGHMAVAASHSGLVLLRCDPVDTEALLAEPRAEPMVMRGREMSGWLQVELDASADDALLARWVDHGVRYVKTLPPK